MSKPFGLLLGVGALLLLALLSGCEIEQKPAPLIQSFETQVLNRSALIYWEVLDPENEPLSCTVDFGDGDTASIPDCQRVRHVFHAYANDGAYTLTFEVRNLSGGRSRQTVTLLIPGSPPRACPPANRALDLNFPEKALPTGVQFTPGPKTVPGKILVRLPEASLQSAVSGIRELGLRVQSTPLPLWASVKTPPGQEKAIAEQLVAQGLATYAQPVYRYRPVGTPNDPYFYDQRAHFAQMQLIAGWEQMKPNACRPIVAVVDSGADFDHRDLGKNLLPGYDFSDDDPDASYDPESKVKEHGTMIAGIIGATTNNGIGIAGSTENRAYVLPLKVFDQGTSETIAEAIRYAADAGAQLINLSLCIQDEVTGHCSDLGNNPEAYIEDALRYAAARGVIAVAASGNYGDPFVGYPASSKYTIAVGSVELDGERSTFSNYGDGLDFVAPGSNVLSTAPGNGYLLGNGTSYATPFAAGVLALYLGQYYAVEDSLPSFSQAVTCLANNTNQTTWNAETGYGVPQADQVLDPADGTCYP